MAYTNEQLGKALEDLTIAYNNFIEKAKEAAIAAMGDTVIAQIRQDAKEFIADELKTQRDELMQAIENAKIALHNSAVEAGIALDKAAEQRIAELTALIPAAEAQLNQIFETAHTKLKETATAMEETMQEKIEQGKKDVVEKLNTLSENTILQIEQAEKTAEKTFEAEVQGFKALAKQEAAHLRNLTQEQLQQLSYGYKDLYDNILFFMNDLESSSKIAKRPLQKIEKIKLPKKDGIIVLLCYGGDYNTEQLVWRASICNTNKEPITVLGYSRFFDVMDEAFIFYNQSLPRYTCFEAERLKTLVFNYYAKDLLLDEDGFSYIAFETTPISNYQISIYGYCTAEVNTNFMQADLPSMSAGHYGSNLYYYGQFCYLNNNNGVKTTVGLPYRSVQKNIIIGFLFKGNIGNQHFLRFLQTFHIRGYATNITYSEVEKPLCNSFKLFKSLEPLLKEKGLCLKFFKIPAQEVIANTELTDSIKMVRLVLWRSLGYNYSDLPMLAIFVDDEQAPVDNLDTLLPPSFKTMKIALDAGAEENWRYGYIPIKPFLTEEKYYIFEADFKVLSGDAAAATVLFYDFTTGAKLAESQTPVIDRQCRITFEFSFTYTAGHTIQFLCYAGEAGKTNGVRCEYSNFSLIEKRF